MLGLLKAIYNLVAHHLSIRLCHFVYVITCMPTKTGLLVFFVTTCKYPPQLGVHIHTQTNATIVRPHFFATKEGSEDTSIRHLSWWNVVVLGGYIICYIIITTADN